ncbi:MAG: alpha/beta fold hydrolase [Myxococcales bacterium]|nr:alpha/beta fold hydrolase [Myxococcales bacterium]
MVKAAAAAGDAAPFRFDGDARGVLLVHGFTGTPFEMRLLGESLARRGLSVVGPRLAGHGAGAKELAATSWHDWYATVESAFDELRTRVGSVAVCGLSLGGLLTLELARRRGKEIAAIASLSAPLWIPRWMMRGVRLAARVRILRDGNLPKIGGSDIVDPVMRKKNPTGRGFPVRAIASLLDCMEHVAAHLGEVDRPALLAHARGDHTAPFECMEAIAGRLRGPVERLILERSAHVITLDVEREELFWRVGDFLERHLTLPGT